MTQGFPVHEKYKTHRTCKISVLVGTCTSDDIHIHRSWADRCCLSTLVYYMHKMKLVLGNSL